MLKNDVPQHMMDTWKLSIERRLIHHYNAVLISVKVQLFNFKDIFYSTLLYCMFLDCFSPSLWLRWFSPPVSWVCLMRCWVQSAPFLQRRLVRLLEPVWTAQKGCWLPARACSSSTHTRTTDKVSCTAYVHHLPLSLSCMSVSLMSSHLQWFFHSHLLLHLSHHLCSVLYSNTEQASVYLTRSSPLSLYQSIQYSSRTIYLCWHHLTDAVRSVHWARTHPRPQFHSRKSLCHLHGGSHHLHLRCVWCHHHHLFPVSL